MILGQVFKRKLRFLTADTSSVKLGRLGVFLVGFIFAHSVVVSYLEGISFGDALWLSYTTITTVGYGDISLSSGEGRLVSAGMMILGGFYLMASLIGVWSELLDKKKERVKMGLNNLNKMSGHIVLMNVPKVDTERYLIALKKELEGNELTRFKEVVLLTSVFDDTGLPAKLSSFKLVSGEYFRVDDIVKSGAENADYVVMFGEKTEQSDAKSLMSLNHLRAISSVATIVCEFRETDNVEALKAAGANRLVRQVRAYPEMILRCIEAPGSEKIVEELIVNDGFSIRKLKNPFDSDMSWSEVLIKLISEKGLTAVGVERYGNPHVPDMNDVIKKEDDFFVLKRS